MRPGYRLLLVALAIGLISYQAWSKPVERIVSLAPGLTELAFSAGLGSQLVGVDSFSDYPAEVKQLPKVGDSRGYSFERIIALKPDWVLAWREGTAQRDILHLQQLGLKVEVISLLSPHDIPRMIKYLSQFSDTPQTGLATAHKLADQLTKLHKTYRNRQRYRYFYQIWDTPLITINGQQFISQSIALCGLQNIFHELDSLAPQVNIETVIALNPDMILLGMSEQPAQRWQATWQRIPQLSAVKNNHILAMDADLLHRPTARMIQHLSELCEKLRPE